MESVGRQSPPEMPRVDIHPPRRVRPSAVRRFAFIIGGFMAFDLLVPPLATQARAELLIGAFLGGVLAQGGLIAIWAALGTPVYWPMRQLQALLLALLACWCLWIGVGMSEAPPMMLREAARGGAFVPLMLLAAQLPLWAARMAPGWRIARGTVGHADEERAGRQFGVFDLLLATAVVAVALGFARLGLWLKPDDSIPAVVAVAFLGVAILSAFTSLPCAWSALGASDQGAGCAAIVLYSVALTILVFSVPAAIVGGGSIEALVVFLMTCFAVTGSMHSVLLVFRDCGYRLQSCSPRSIAPELAKSDAANPGEA